MTYFHFSMYQAQVERTNKVFGHDHHFGIYLTLISILFSFTNVAYILFLAQNTFSQQKPFLILLSLSLVLPAGSNIFQNYAKRERE